MSLKFAIVDDDVASRKMLQNIVEDTSLGEVVGLASGGTEGVGLILDALPDVVLIDLLMPDKDGIETIMEAKEQGFRGKFIMISQISNKDLVGHAYQSGIDFFIHKPINRLEVEAVLMKVNERWRYERYIYDIKQTLAAFEGMEQLPLRNRRTVRDVMCSILMELGIVGEIGSKDIVSIIEDLIEHPRSSGFPPLKELYEAVASRYKQSPSEIEKERKAIEQRIRRAVMTALTNLASIGLTDYGNPKFEHYAPLYFDFEDVRRKMRVMEEDPSQDKGKVNIKKFLQVLYLEVREKLRK
ncbi:two-component system response regulator YcbB [Paenibacillus rhizosphaerae]|uniref:Two-component system response regulator YcbB n=1 Tax=Paenibacillus rhizosphaerae TaxID=297318 RepID=A0A839TTE2_9BACL|nr:response regulator [Paenibacillus rhizosphaerae]MBB3130055.1 two-component system response regulator YcbB [Paenibacillus rhizosphaerae]